MDFYLVRHGNAESAAQNPHRPLSELGRRQVEKVGSLAAQKGVQVFAVVHSGKLRAKETAEILARYLSPSEGRREERYLAPEEDPQVARTELETAPRPIMLVGHLPHLGRLVSLLLTADPDREDFHLPEAAVVCLSRAAGRWRLQWTATPDDA